MVDVAEFPLLFFFGFCNALCFFSFFFLLSLHDLVIDVSLWMFIVVVISFSMNSTMWLCKHIIFYHVWIQHVCLCLVYASWVEPFNRSRIFFPAVFCFLYPIPIYVFYDCNFCHCFFYFILVANTIVLPEIKMWTKKKSEEKSTKSEWT